MTSAEAPTTPWTRAADPKPGPRPAFTLDRIAAACVRLADDSGWRAVSMRKVAQELGTAAASLYRYVRSKDDLAALMIDHVCAEYVYPPFTGDVRADVLALAEQARRTHRRHPWLGQLGVPVLGPRAMSYLDRMVGALAPAGLDAHSTMMGVALLSGWVTTFAAQEAAGSGPTVSVSMSDVFGVTPSPNEFPHLAALATTAATGGATVPFDVDAAFRAGIDALLFGIAPNR